MLGVFSQTTAKGFGMISAVTQMGALILCGLAWRVLRPGGLDADSTRQALTGTVYYLLLPALVLAVLWKTSLGLDSVRISLVAAVVVLFSLLAIALLCRLCVNTPAAAGALMLAAGFPNATYLGLPVLQRLYGEQGRSIAIQFDLFACTPLLLTVGILIARRFGNRGPNEHWLSGLVRVPPLWAAAAGVTLNLTGVAFSPWLERWLEMMAVSVAPLMLFSLGLGLRLDTWRWRHVPALMPVVVLQLLLMPLVAWALAQSLGLTGTLRTGVVLEAAMPSMVLGIVLCDRFGLDTGLYAAAVTLTTAVSLLTLPLWYGWLG